MSGNRSLLGKGSPVPKWYNKIIVHLHASEGILGRCVQRAECGETSYLSPCSLQGTEWSLK